LTLFRLMRFWPSRRTEMKQPTTILSSGT
jgi:hypothetical protein